MTPSDLAVRLPRSYDVGRLRADLLSIEGEERVPNSGSYHGGEWRGVSLWAPGGRANTADSSSKSLADYAPTPILEKTPYLRELLEELRCPKYSARVLYLPPGGVIRPHADQYHGFESGKLRLHVPIVTHDDVVFVLGGQRLRWSPGELWYGDFAYTHSVENRSPILRVHAVIDVGVNDFVLGMFPPEMAARKEALGILRQSEPLDLQNEELARYACDFWVPPLSLPRSDGDRVTAFDEQVGRLRMTKHGLALSVGREAIGLLRPISPRELQVAGSPQMRVNLDFEGGRITAVTVSIYGVPEIFRRALSSKVGIPMAVLAAPTADAAPEKKQVHRVRMPVID